MRTNQCFNQNYQQGGLQNWFAFVVRMVRNKGDYNNGETTQKKTSERNFKGVHKTTKTTFAKCPKRSKSGKEGSMVVLNTHVIIAST